MWPSIFGAPFNWRMFLTARQIGSCTYLIGGGMGNASHEAANILWSSQHFTWLAAKQNNAEEIAWALLHSGLGFCSTACSRYTVKLFGVVELLVLTVVILQLHCVRTASAPVQKNSCGLTWGSPFAKMVSCAMHCLLSNPDCPPQTHSSVRMCWTCLLSYFACPMLSSSLIHLRIIFVFRI